MSQKALLVDRYRYLRTLGRGGFSEVFLAEDVRLGNRKVAIKRMASHLHHDAERVEKFQQEAEIVGRLTSPHIVRAYDYGRDQDGHYFIALEYAEGKTFHEVLKKEGPLSVERCIHIGIQLLDALEEAHQLGIIHRDLKPKNIIIVTQRTGDLVKVLDFGVARILDPDEDSEDWTLVGTASYMAPEQAQGKAISAASDLYSVAILLYHALTGKPPFVSKEDPVAVMIHHATTPVQPMREARPDLDIPEEFDHILLRALQKDPTQRTQSAAQFRSELEALWDALDEDRTHTHESSVSSSDTLLVYASGSEISKQTLSWGTNLPAPQSGTLHAHLPPPPMVKSAALDIAQNSDSNASSDASSKAYARERDHMHTHGYGDASDLVAAQIPTIDESQKPLQPRHEEDAELLSDLRALQPPPTSPDLQHAELHEQGDPTDVQIHTASSEVPSTVDLKPHALSSSDLQAPAAREATPTHDSAAWNASPNQVDEDVGESTFSLQPISPPVQATHLEHFDEVEDATVVQSATSNPHLEDVGDATQSSDLSPFFIGMPDPGQTLPQTPAQSFMLPVNSTPLQVHPQHKEQTPATLETAASTPSAQWSQPELPATLQDGELAQASNASHEIDWIDKTIDGTDPTIPRAWWDSMGFWLGLVCVVGLIVLWFFSGESHEEKHKRRVNLGYREAMKAGRVSFQKGLYRRAYTSYKEALKWRPNDVKAMRAFQTAQINLDADTLLKQAKRFERLRRPFLAYRILGKMHPTSRLWSSGQSYKIQLKSKLLVRILQHVPRLRRKRKWREAHIACIQLKQLSPQHAWNKKLCPYIQRMYLRIQKRR